MVGTRTAFYYEMINTTSIEWQRPTTSIQPYLLVQLDVQSTSLYYYLNNLFIYKTSQLHNGQLVTQVGWNDLASRLKRPSRSTRLGFRLTNANEGEFIQHSRGLTMPLPTTPKKEQKNLCLN